MTISDRHQKVSLYHSKNSLEVIFEKPKKIKCDINIEENVNSHHNHHENHLSNSNNENDKTNFY